MTRAARLVTNALIVVVALRIWHILILRLFLDRPFLVAVWLTAMFGLLVLARSLAKTTPPVRRRFPEQLWAQLDGAGLTFAAFFLCLVFLFHWGFERAMSDGREYFVIVRSLVIDRDLEFSNERAVFTIGRGAFSSIPFGAPLLWSPFFVFCRLWLGMLNRLGGSFAVDGYGIPFQKAIGLGTLIYGFAGLVLIYRMLADYFSRKLATAATLTLCCGSFLVWYLIVESSMLHGASMFATALFLFLWSRTRNGCSRLQWGLVGASAGLMAMVRWQDSLFVVVPLLYSTVRAWRSRQGPSRVASVFADVGVFGAGALVVFSPQFVFWGVQRQSLSQLPGAYAVHVTSLHVWDVLFSSDHGLLSWTPLIYIALLGLPLFFRRDRILFAVLAVGFLAQLYVNSTLDVWSGGAAFGARRFANCAIVFAFGLASILDWARRRPLVAPGFILGALLVTNATFMADVKNGTLPSEGGVTFDRIQNSLYQRLGNPFSFPGNAVTAWKYDIGWTSYDRLGRRAYDDLTIDLGERTDDEFLGSGWSGRERSPGASFRWATGLESVVLVPLAAADNYQLELRCGPFVYPNMPSPQVVEVLANGQSAGRVVFDKGMFPYTIEIPARLLKSSLNQIRLRYAHATSPVGLGLSADRRSLAIQCDTLKFTRLLVKGS